jgi:hypothetical protein
VLGGGMAERIEDRHGARMGWDECSADSGGYLHHMLRTQVVLGTVPRYVQAVSQVVNARHTRAAR